MEINNTHKLDISELINALHIRRKWNNLDVDSFIEAYLEYYKPEDPEDITENIRKGVEFIGLTNSDFIPMSVQKF